MATPITHTDTRTRAAFGMGRRRAAWLVCLVYCVLSVWSVAGWTRTIQAASHTEPGASGFEVIVHASNPISGISQEVVTQAFLKRTTRWGDGQLIRPVDLRI